ncbi:MAG: hypothetical protein JNL21_23975 [Myxococcales bacterium]|nr:hypothetical protein [Myxococcales bacterium]
MRNVDLSHALPVAALLVVVAGGCAASKEMPAESAAAGAAAEPATKTGPGRPATGNAPPAQPELTNRTPFEELDRAEQELAGALERKPNVADGLATGDRCTTVCKALASMRRSADQICTLDAQRCPDARARVTKAEERAKSACPACSTPT